MEEKRILCRDSYKIIGGMIHMIIDEEARYLSQNMYSRG